MTPINPQSIISVIKGIDKVVSTAPAVINAANHVVTNGVRTGGYNIIKNAWQGIAQNTTSLTNMKDVGNAAFQGLQNSFQGSGSLTKDILTLGRIVKGRYVPTKAVTPISNTCSSKVFNATDKVNHAITESAPASVTTALGSVSSAAAKGGLAGIVIGVTTETINSYQKYKDGQISKEEYTTEIVKSGAQMGITGAATAGIMTAVSIPLTATGLATAPITIPVSIILGAGIDKIVAPAFGRGEYEKILNEAKYYQNMMYAHDDLIAAIAATETQFVAFINEYEKQMLVHGQLTDTNSQINQLHNVANHQLEQQVSQLNNTFATLGDLYNNI